MLGDLLYIKNLFLYEQIKYPLEYESSIFCIYFTISTSSLLLLETECLFQITNDYFITVS